MIASLRPYPENKDSRVPWLGQIPKHWELRKLRHCAAIAGGMTPPMNEPAFWGGDVPWVTPKDMKRFLIHDSLDRVTDAATERTSLRRIPAGSVLLVVRGMILARRVPIALATGPITINQDMKALIPYPGVSGAFLARALDSARDAFAPLIDEAGHGTRRLPTERWRDLLIPVPPPAEQGGIARFLAHLDQLVARQLRSKERLLRLLNEQKQVIIHRAVTRGLDPNVRLKPSGIDWLGDVPDHWQVRSVRRVISLITSGSRSWAEFYSDEGDVFIQSGNLGRSMAVDLSHVKRVRIPPGAEGRRTRVARNDVLVCITGALTGNVAMVAEDPPPAYVNQHVAILRPVSERVLPRFLAYALHSAYVQAQFRLSEYGGTKQGLGLDDVRDILVIRPILEEQGNIVARLDREAARVANVIDKTMREISLLREHRIRLIADVVAGKVDVRDVALMTLDDDLPEVVDTREDQGEDEPADPEGGGDADE